MSLYQLIVDNPVRRSIGNFLQRTVYKSDMVSLDLWSIVHVIAGMGIMWLLILWKGKSNLKYLWLLGAVVLYEIIEVFLYKNMTLLFIPENITNVFWDIIVAMIGGAWVDFLYRSTQ